MDWYVKQPWLVGSNFTPSTAVNQLEMWQPETFDPEVIDRELRFAEGLGFTSMRVFLHHLLWQDSEGFLRRIDQFLEIASRHKIGIIFVLLDGVWNPQPIPGAQPAPRPGVHNSQWVQSPGAEILGDPARHDELRPYIQGVISRFREDPRVQAWDIFNEPDNPNSYSYVSLEPKDKAALALALIQKAYGWAREVGPTQPITSAVWLGNWEDPAKLTDLERFCLDESDVVSFHSYSPLANLQAQVTDLRRYQRPILITEYLARPQKSTFDPLLGYFKQERIGAYNWGLVAGKSQTNYPWDSWQKPYPREPRLWFHDIFRPNGDPFDPVEVTYIRKVTAKRRAPRQHRRH